MILKYNNEKVVNLVKYFETLDLIETFPPEIDKVFTYVSEYETDEFIPFLEVLFQPM